MNRFTLSVTAATLLAGGAFIATPAIAAGPVGIEGAAGMQFAFADRRNHRNRGHYRHDRRPQQNSARTSTEAGVITTRRGAVAVVNTQGEARGTGTVWSSSEGDVYARTDGSGSEADAYGRSEAEARESRRRRPR